jgi:hypothetical protein
MTFDVKGAIFVEAMMIDYNHFCEVQKLFPSYRTVHDSFPSYDSSLSMTWSYGHRMPQTNHGTDNLASICLNNNGSNRSYAM